MAPTFFERKNELSNSSIQSQNPSLKSLSKADKPTLTHKLYSKTESKTPSEKNKVSSDMPKRFVPSNDPERLSRVMDEKTRMIGASI
jgi:hypothetical protein